MIGLVKKKEKFKDKGFVVLELKQGGILMSDKPLTIRDLTHELDFGMGAIENLVSKIADTEVEFSQLVEKMDEVEHRGEERLYYREHSRKVRVLSNLMHYLVHELEREVEKTGNIRYAFFESVVEKKEVQL